DLRGGETVRARGSSTLQHPWIEPAALRIGDQAVLQAIARIARVDDGAMQQLLVFGGKASGVVVLQRLRDPDRLRRAPGPIEAGRTGNDAVKIVREALCLLHRLPATGGAA